MVIVTNYPLIHAHASDVWFSCRLGPCDDEKNNEKTDQKSQIVFPEIES